MLEEKEMLNVLILKNGIHGFHLKIVNVLKPLGTVPSVIKELKVVHALLSLVLYKTFHNQNFVKIIIISAKDIEKCQEIHVMEVYNMLH